jgi:hypothetical protein
MRPAVNLGEDRSLRSATARSCIGLLKDTPGPLGWG